MKVFIVIFLGLISTVIGQSASLSALMNKMARASLRDQQGLTSQIQSSPITTNQSINKPNVLPIILPPKLLHQDVTNSVRLQEQVSQLSMTQLELSRQILSRIMELQTQLPKPLHQVMDKTPKNKPMMTNIPMSQMHSMLSLPAAPNTLGQIQPPSSPSLLKTNQGNRVSNTNIPIESSTSPRRLGLGTISKDTMASKPALPQQTIVLVDLQPNNVSGSTKNVVSTTKKMQPRLANTIQPILNAIRSRMASTISSQVHSSHPQLGKESASTLFVDHSKQLPSTSQKPSTNFNIINTNKKSNPSTIPKSIQVSPLTSNFQSLSTNNLSNGLLGVNQPGITKGSPSNIRRVKDSSLLFVTLPSQLANPNPSVPSPPLNFPGSTPRILRTEHRAANNQPNHSTVKPSNNFGLPQNLPSNLGHSNAVSNKNPHQSLGSIVSELQTLISKLEFLQYDLKLSQLLQSNPALSSPNIPRSPSINLSPNVPRSPAINSSTKNIQGSLKKSPAVFPDNFSAFSPDPNSLTQNILNNHQVQQTPFSLNQPFTHTLAAESRNHPVIHSIASVSQNQPMSQRKIDSTSQLPVQSTDASTSTNQPNKRRFNLHPYSYAYHVRDAATNNFQSKGEIMNVMGDVTGSYNFEDPRGTVSLTNTYDVSGITRHGPTQQLTNQQMLIPRTG